VDLDAIVYRVRTTVEGVWIESEMTVASFDESDIRIGTAASLVPLHLYLLQGHGGRDVADAIAVRDRQGRLAAEKTAALNCGGPDTSIVSSAIDKNVSSHD